MGGLVSIVSYSRLSYSVLNVKVVVAVFNQEKALVGAFSVITNLRMELFEALVGCPSPASAAAAEEHKQTVS